MKRYELSPGARADIDALWEYIADQSIDAADRMIAAIEDSLDRLADFPEMGRRHQDFSQNDWRFYATRHDTVIAQASQTIAVARVFGRGRDIERAFE